MLAIRPTVIRSGSGSPWAPCLCHSDLAAPDVRRQTSVRMIGMLDSLNASTLPTEVGPSPGVRSTGPRSMASWPQLLMRLPQTHAYAAGTRTTSLGYRSGMSRWSSFGHVAGYWDRVSCTRLATDVPDSTATWCPPETSLTTTMLLARSREKRKHNYEGAEFILEPISDSVIRVTHREETGYFGLRGGWEPNRPYTWTQFESMVHSGGITMPMGLESGFTYSSSDAALDTLCEAMLDDQRVADARRVNTEEREAVARRVLGELLEDIPAVSVDDPPDPGLSSGQTADEGTPVNDGHSMEEPIDGEKVVPVRLEDLCRIADAISTTVIDLDNGKWKYVKIELDSIHEVVEK